MLILKRFLLFPTIEYNSPLLMHVIAIKSVNLVLVDCDGDYIAMRCRNSKNDYFFCKLSL